MQQRCKIDLPNDPDSLFDILDLLEDRLVANPPATPEKPKGRNAAKTKPATPKKKPTSKATNNATTTLETPSPVPESPRKSRKKKKSDPGEIVETLVAVEIPPHEKSIRRKKKASKPEAEGEKPVDTMNTEAPPTPAPTAPTAPTALSIPPAPQEPPKSPSKQPHTGSGSATKANPVPVLGVQLSKFNKTDSASMFRIKNGKASITETKLKFMSHPSSIADLCKFHEYRQALQDEDHGMREDVRQLEDHFEITRIPSNHYGLIAKLVEESELLLAELATSIMATLCPREFAAFEDFGATEEGDVAMDVDVESEGNPGQRRGATTVSTTAIMEAIQSVAQRVNYGVPVSNLPVSVPATPANLSVFRWEVQDADQHFPPDMKAAVIKRRGKRMEASAALTAWFLGLDRKQQEDLCPVPVATVRPVTEGAPVPTKRNRTSMGGDLMDIDMDLSHTKMVKEADNAPPTALVAASIFEDQATVEASVDPAVLESKLKEIEAKKKEAEAKKKEAEAKEERRLEKERKLAERQHEKDMREAERLQKEETKKQVCNPYRELWGRVVSIKILTPCSCLFPALVCSLLLFVLCYFRLLSDLLASSSLWRRLWPRRRFLSCKPRTIRPSPAFWNCSTRFTSKRTRLWLSLTGSPRSCPPKNLINRSPRHQRTTWMLTTFPSWMSRVPKLNSRPCLAERLGAQIGRMLPTTRLRSCHLTI